jgi:hypothetical protein
MSESKETINEKDCKKIKEYGLIVDFVEKEKTPKFLHQSYAEYFIAKSVCQNKIQYKNEIERLFTERKYFLIRIFVNEILKKIELKKKMTKLVY